jgi:hypothetical protein
MSLRNDIAEDIVKTLKELTDPRPILVTREPFDVEKLAITQFPAIMVNSGNEERDDYDMAFRSGTIEYTLQAFVRGATQLDRQKNDLIEAISEGLDTDRRRGTSNPGITTLVANIEVVDRLPPLAEVVVTVQVRYRYRKGAE